MAKYNWTSDMASFPIHGTPFLPTTTTTIETVLPLVDTAPIDPPCQGSFKIQRPSSGGDLPQFRRVNSNTLTMFVDNDVDGGNLGPYADRPRIFPNMRSKVHTPLIFRILMGINVRVLLMLLLLGLGAIF
nr:pyrophosphate-energized membrane proton pump 2 [Quercus suber]